VQFPARPPLRLLLPGLAVGGAVLLPMVYLLWRALEATPSGLAEIVLRPRNAWLLGQTLLLMVGVQLGTALLALPLAWLTARTPLGKYPLLTLLLTLPLAIPGYVGAFTLLAATGPSGLLANTLGLDLPRPSGYWGALGVLVLFTYPYLFLNLRAALLGLDPSHEEAALSLGYTRWQAFWQVTWPQLRPALLAGWLLIGLHVLGDFGVVSLMRYETFSLAIYTQYSASFDRIYAAWLSLMLLILTGSLLWLEARLLRSLSLSRVGLGVSRKPRWVALGHWRWLAYLGLLLPLVGGLLIPLSTILYWLLRWPLDTYSLGGLLERLSHTALAAAPAALAASLLALPLAYLGVRFPTRLSRALERTAYLGYAMPPLAFALALIFFTLRAVPDLYQTLALLILAYTLHFLAEAIGPIRTALFQASARLEEAARSLGFSPLGAFIRVTLPLLWRGALASTALVFLSCVKELPLTFLLAPVGFDTLATRVWGYTSEAMYAEAAPHALLIVAFSALFVGLLLTREDR
jgi:iron(III) transport system permease protein